MMKILFITLLTITGIYATSIYSLKVNGIDNKSINFNDFKGKKILLVNIATGSANVKQLAQLEKLNRQFKNTLIIIGFPSNSFGNEPRSNAEIQKFCKDKYNVSFLIAAKGSVKGNDIQRVYTWLTHTKENGVMEGEIKDDFQKYLIDSNGDLLGIFSGDKAADHPGIIQAINGN